ncbi:MAG: type II secretion system major pseudopilin GspG [Armatimonadota bacterium]|jgi:general secretion pathway protein G
MFRSSRRGLTPAETLIVAAIVAIFALIISWRFVGEPSLEARTLTINRVEAVMEALERYAIDSGGVFPTTDEGLDALVTRPTDGDAPPRWSGPYVEDPALLMDAWGAPLKYVSPVAGGRPYHLWSNGADRAEGGEGANADIKSWDRSSMVP